MQVLTICSHTHTRLSKTPDLHGDKTAKKNLKSWGGFGDNFGKLGFSDPAFQKKIRKGVKAMNGNGSKNGLTYEEKVAWELFKIIKNESGRAVHTVFSGFNTILRNKGIDPIRTVESLVKKGILYCRPAKGGAVIDNEPFLSSRAKIYERKLEEILNKK